MLDIAAFGACTNGCVGALGPAKLVVHTGDPVLCRSGEEKRGRWFLALLGHPIRCIRARGVIIESCIDKEPRYDRSRIGSLAARTKDRRSD